MAEVGGRAAQTEEGELGTYSRFKYIWRDGRKN
jgi:hypothetical protein